MSEGELNISVDGQWLTDHARDRLLEGDEGGAFRILSSMVPNPESVQDAGPEAKETRWDHMAISCAVLAGDSAFLSEPPSYSEDGRTFDGRTILAPETEPRRTLWRKKLMAAFGGRQKIGAEWFKPVGILKMTANTVSALVERAERLGEFQLLHQYTRIRLHNGECLVRWDQAEEEGVSLIEGTSLLVVFKRCDQPPIILAITEESRDGPVLWDSHPRHLELSSNAGMMALGEVSLDGLSYADRVSRTAKMMELYGERTAQALVCGHPISEDVILKYDEARDRRDELEAKELERRRQPKPQVYETWCVGKEEPCADIWAETNTSLFVTPDAAGLPRAPTDEDVQACVAEIRRQAEHSGWITFPLNEDTCVKVPRGAFECYALGRCGPELRGQATHWLRISGRHWKQIGDCRYHTDCILGGTLYSAVPLGTNHPPDGSALSLHAWDDVEGLSEAAYAHMEVVQRAARESLDNKTYGPLGNARPRIQRMTVLCGEGLVSGKVVVVQRPKAGADAPEVPPDTIAILPNGTAPYEPVMRTAAACILAKGGKTCHLVNIGRGSGARMVRLDETACEALVGRAPPWSWRAGRKLSPEDRMSALEDDWGPAPVVSLDLDEGLCSTLGDEE
jgi:hypothetical protein